MDWRLPHDRFFILRSDITINVGSSIKFNCAEDCSCFNTSNMIWQTCFMYQIEFTTLAHKWWRAWRRHGRSRTRSLKYQVQVFVTHRDRFFIFIERTCFEGHVFSTCFCYGKKVLIVIEMHMTLYSKKEQLIPALYMYILVVHFTWTFSKHITKVHFMEHLNCTSHTHIYNENDLPAVHRLCHWLMGNISFVPLLVFFLARLFSAAEHPNCNRVSSQW